MELWDPLLLRKWILDHKPTSELVNDASHVLKKQNFLNFLSLGYNVPTPPGLMKVSGLWSQGEGPFGAEVLEAGLIQIVREPLKTVLRKFGTLKII